MTEMSDVLQVVDRIADAVGTVSRDLVAVAGRVSAIEAGEIGMAARGLIDGMDDRLTALDEVVQGLGRRLTEFVADSTSERVDKARAANPAGDAFKAAREAQGAHDELLSVTGGKHFAQAAQRPMPIETVHVPGPGNATYSVKGAADAAERLNGGGGWHLWEAVAQFGEGTAGVIFADADDRETAEPVASVTLGLDPWLILHRVGGAVAVALTEDDAGRALAELSNGLPWTRSTVGEDGIYGVAVSVPAALRPPGTAILATGTHIAVPIPAYTES